MEGDARRGWLSSMLGEVGHGEGVGVMARWMQLGEAMKQRQGRVTVARHGAVGLDVAAYRIVKEETKA